MKSVGLRRAASAVLAVSLGSLGLVAVTTGGAVAAGVPCQRTFTSGAVNIPIPDQSTITSTIDVPEDGLVISDVNVTLNIHHTFDNDLQIFVDSETDASTIRADALIVHDAGGSGDNFLGTVLDDQATTPIGFGDAPFTGSYTPTNKLSQLNGFAGGQYVLQVTDQFAQDTGTLNDWAITVRYASCNFDNDAVEDHSDSCLQIAASTASGCPLATRTVTSRYRLGKFRGTLSSSVPACRAGRSVKIWKVRSGPDRLIGTATTRSDGTYRLTRARHHGRYYANAPRTVVTDVAECAAAQSAIFRIR